MTLEGLDRVPQPQKDPEASWRSVRLVGSVVPAVSLLVLAIGLLLRPETRVWADVRLSVAVFAVLGIADMLLAPWFVRATMLAALAAFARRRTQASEATVATAIAPLLIAQVAACELPSLLGFVAYMLGAPLGVFLAFVAVSFIGYAYFYPRRSQWETWLAIARPMHSSIPPSV